MDGKIAFTSIKVMNSSKTKLNVDGNGYYDVILGAVNAFNGNGAYYLEDGIRELVENDSSLLGRRLKGGYLRGEAEHPVRSVGMTNDEFYLRNTRIDKDRVSHAIKEITFEKTTKVPNSVNNSEMVLIRGKVKPLEPMGSGLQQELDDIDINTGFSIRCFTKDERVRGILVKRILNIITWDWITEPGISVANKWHALSTENLFSIVSRDIYSVSTEELKVALDKAVCENCSFESGDEYKVISEVIKSAERKSIITSW